jgi:hypothetical protein
MKKIVALSLAVLLLASCGERQTQLFNGKDLSGWVLHVNPESEVPATDVFGVQDGVITIAGEPFGYMMTEQSFGDYKLHVEWRWVGEPSNSGLFQRCIPTEGVWPDCAEVNLMAGRAGDMISLSETPFDELKETGGRFLRSEAESAEKPAGEWNTPEIICQGTHIQAWINGVLMNEAHFSRTEGPIALQSEGGPLEIRNVYLVPVK